MRAPAPANEAERLRALASYGVLDTDPDAVFDDLTTLAAHVCGTPMSLISLIDRDRQWFRSRLGPFGSETTRDVSFCAHAILEHDLFVVPDASADDRFADNPLVVGEPNIRFYAGAQLVTGEGHQLGTLCVLDREPRELSPEQRVALESLARAVMAHLELHRQNVQLRELDRLKDEFVSLVSHELRTPLTSIRGYVELLLEGMPGPLTVDQERFLRIVERNGDRLLAIVNDLLFLARVQADSVDLDLADVDVTEVAVECLESIEPVAREKGVELVARTNGAIFVTADRSRVCQVVDNLLSNAVKFTPGGGSVELRVARADNEAVVEVADNGVGIAPDELPHLFSRFYRTAGAARDAVPGTGLGLAISKAIAESHDGAIDVESEPGRGTTFRLRLPLTGAAA